MSKQEEANYSEFLTKVGFEEKTIKNILKSKDLAAKIHGIYTKTNFEEKCELKSGLIYTLCTINNPEINPHIDLISGHIFTGKIKNKQQLKLAETFVLKNKEVKDQGEFDKYCGVGVEVTDSDIDTYVRNFLKTNADLLRKNDFKITHPDVLNALKEGFQLANPTQLMKVATDLTKELFAEELKAVTEGGDKKKDKKKKEEAEVKENGTEEETFQKIDISKLVARDMAWSLNDEATMKKHLEVTGGKTITRFPPEPNGILHIGHARAIRFNFSIAGLYKGDCNLRYDDTNPEKEKKEYMDMIEDNVEWMGFKPSIKVHCSNYFPQIYDWTLELIKKGKAYACKLPVETMRKYKEDMIPSPYRDTTPEENLREFELMKSGYYDEGEIVLRAKIDYKSPVTTLRDPVLYRILYTPHPVSGSTWCIYPMYDYAHPLSDSIENITHSCCTLEFETRRELYYWPLQELGLYKPFVWEFSRLNIEYTLTSKRKILQLIADK
jgi:glutaminyl-tRNA synthetase